MSANSSSSWSKVWSSSKKAYYWYNDDTKESRWEAPVMSEDVWEEKFSKTHSMPYWYNERTGESVWTKPSVVGKGEGGKKRKRDDHEGAQDGTLLSPSSIMKKLEEEDAQFRVNQPACPRLKSKVDVANLLQRLRSEMPNQVTYGDENDHRVVFTLPNEDTSQITRAIQEDQILNTRLKLRRGDKVVDLPSFWEVWRDNPNFQSEISCSGDPNEAKWSLARKYGYKMATTFMPAYAKAIYRYFRASQVLDPCAGWGDRLLGAETAGVTRYTAFDPNRSLRPGYAKIMGLCGHQTTVFSQTRLEFSNGFQINSLPFEKGAEAIRDHSYDLVFTSPPFFDYEMYTPSNPGYKDWLTEFYEPLFQHSARCVRPGGFVAIHIGDTSAGNIERFLKERVRHICPLQLVFCLGLTGVMSNSVRTVWVFRSTLEVAPRSLQPAPSLNRQGLKEWATRMTNPPMTPRPIRDPSLPGVTFTLLDDGQCVGGTKQRLLGKFLGTIPHKEVVYAGPDGGMAQVALAYTAALWGKKAVVFLNGSSDGSSLPLVRLAAGLGADIHLGQTYTTLKEAEEKAAAYVKADEKNRYASPFGFRCERGDPLFEMFREVLVIALAGISPPSRLWLVSGSGFILDVLHSIWPSTKFMIVQVGKKIWKEVLEGKSHELFVAPQRFAETTPLLPPYPSVPWYDAKLWQFALQHGRDGDYIWNVAAVPSDPDRVAQETLRVIESTRLK